MFRSSDRGRGLVGGELEDNLATLTSQDDQMSDDDNAAPEIQSELDEQGLEQQAEDPFQLALDDLEGRVVSVLDDVKLHPGIRSNDDYQSVQEELASLLRPVMEVAAHTAPSIARTYYQGVGAEGVEASCEEVYQRVVSDLVLPVLLEMAQSDTIPAKRGASLEFFRGLYKECQKPGSWLDVNHQNANAGPYGNGTSSSKHHHHHSSSQRQPPAQIKRRQAKRLQREGEILRYWVQASIACTTPGVFTDEASEASVAARGVIAASASIRPSLKHIAQRIRDADDRGANKVFGPVMKMVEGVLRKLFLSGSTDVEQGDALRSACIKFLEIVCLCCSAKPQDASSKRKGHTPDDFSLEDLPAGHPIITREALESIADYAFSTLRGLTMMGGQVKIDENLVSDLLMGEASRLPSAAVVSILKPAALGYLEIESNLPSGDAENALEIHIDRSSLEYDFVLSQKSYALTVNAIAALGSNRPVFFKDAAVCLGRRCADPPIFAEEEGVHNQLPKPAVLAIRSQLRSSCLTLLRNALSVQTKGSFILHKVLKEKCDMEIQADKALKMAEQTTALKTAGRAARNRANMFYEWDTSAADERTSKRQRETDDALAKMRAAKAKRGLGHGIQLPTSMVDAIELVLENLKYLPSKRPGSATSSKKKSPMTLDFFVDAIMTNGASLTQEEGRWYSRDGGTAWKVHVDDQESRFTLSSNLIRVEKSDEGEKRKDVKLDQKEIFDSECKTAASEALGRIVVNSLVSRNDEFSEFANIVAARLAWTLKETPPSTHLKAAHEMALESIASSKNRIDDEKRKEKIDSLATSFPLVVSCLSLQSTSTVSYGPGSPFTDGRSSLSNALLNEAYLKEMQTDDSDQVAADMTNYDSSLDVFIGSVVHASERCNDKPSDAEKKKVATDSAGSLQKELGILPSLSESAFVLVSAMCDLDGITKRAAEAGRKTSQQTIAASAALNAAKQAAEKRANAALLVLRDACFQRNKKETRNQAIRTAVRLATGKMAASSSCEDKALKLVINLLYPRSQDIADGVVEAATAELEDISRFAQQQYSKIQRANKEAKEKSTSSDQSIGKSPLAPESEEEKEAMDKARKTVLLFLALCVRRQDLIKPLFELSSVEKADVLSKTVCQQMPKLARAVGIKNGPAEVALEVADVTTTAETPLLLSLLDALAPLGEKGMVSQEFIDACYKIQENKAAGDRKNPRFLIPIVFAIKREELISKLPEFVDANDDVFMSALVKMAERLGRQILLFRDEPDSSEPSLKGMTHTEQLVYLHNLDFEAADLPQRRYLDAIRMCLEREEIFNDRVVMSALDHMSGTFLAGEQPLPLAFMRTVILVCSKHESLHSWICHTLLPRLVEGKIYEDKRQWEGWMRCAKMLENSGETGVSSEEAIRNLPPEQLAIYRDRYGS
ncbi:symplekin tight junction domain containing protein [Nitzschia inconspicua]|uniref:Symplekin tight junction domain containing protein n=1 Tax=Nitzschia inconspicua TaxID=303405 RepID=A0A9K3PN59_9STRA|nr:symplekin tight junction domain containing protein [Nitzschia inconspicua]